VGRPCGWLRSRSTNACRSVQNEKVPDSAPTTPTIGTPPPQGAWGGGEGSQRSRGLQGMRCVEREVRDGGLPGLEIGRSVGLGLGL